MRRECVLLNQSHKMTFCTNCGGDIDDQHNFCAKCGNAKTPGTIKVPDTEVKKPKLIKPRHIFSGMVLLGVFLFLLVVTASLIVFVLPVQYTATEGYNENVPYTDIEYYQEQVPITVEECKNDISLDPSKYIERGINNLGSIINGDVSKLLETCKDVNKIQSVTKSREVTKWKTVYKERKVTKTATYYLLWTQQVQYYYPPN
jgi:ribosomal protein L32